MDRKTKKWVKQLDNDSPKVRYEAVLALGNLGDTTLTDQLDKIANLDDHPKVRHLASQAVSVLEVLAQRQRTRELQRLAEAEGDDPGLEWPELMHEKMLKHREISSDDNEDDYSYERVRQVERMSEEERQQFFADQAQADAEAAEEAKRRRKSRGGRRRLILWLAASIGLLGLAILSWYALTIRPDAAPEDRQAVLESLQSWVIEQQDVTNRYEAVLATDPVSCQAAKEISLPANPRWAELREGSLLSGQQTSGLLGSYADDLMRTKGENLVGLELLIAQAEDTTLDLGRVHEVVQLACQDSEEIPLATWQQLESDGQISGLLVGIDRALLGLASSIEQELNP